MIDRETHRQAYLNKRKGSRRSSRRTKQIEENWRQEDAIRQQGSQKK